MSKNQPQARRAKQAPPRQTNWALVGGIVGGGAVLLIVLILLASLRDSESLNPRDEATRQAGELTGAQASLESYCASNPTRCYASGDAAAPVTVFEFSDYGCGHCRDFNLEGPADLLEEQYVVTGEVQWVIMPYALSQATMPAAASAMCAAEQDQLLSYHKAMFVLQGQPQALQLDGFMQAATTAGLDLEAFEACVRAGQNLDDIASNMELANRVGVEGTPTFYVNGEQVVGNNPLGLQQAIEAVLTP